MSWKEAVQGGLSPFLNHWCLKLDLDVWMCFLPVHHFDC